MRQTLSSITSIKQKNTTNKVLLKRNLTFNNLKKTDNTITDYYLHILTTDLSKREMNSYIKNFINQRNKSSFNIECFTCINRFNIKEIRASEEFDDKDYYIDFLGCIFCKEEFNSFISLFYHTQIMHENYECFLSSRPWTNVTQIKEAHIVVYPSQSYSKSTTITNDDKNYHFYREGDKNKMLLIKGLVKADINDDTDDNNDENGGFKGKISNLKNNLGSANAGDHSSTIFKKYKGNLNSDERIFFHSVTGEILSENSEDSDYEVDNDDIIEFDAKDIDQYTDICEKDKEFFKLWNRYVNTNKNKSICHMEKILHEFLQKFGKDIIKKDLNENFILHLICLYDYQQVDKDIMARIVRQFDEMKI